VSDLINWAGIDRLGFSPPLTATVAWSLAHGNNPTDVELERLCTSHFATELTPGYVERFKLVTRSKSLQSSEESPGSLEFLEEAILTADADLRKIVVSTEPQGTFSDDSSFDSHTIYTTARDLIEGLRGRLEGLARFELSRCPRCGLTAELETWFGHRLMAGRTLPQSWCRVCRALDRESSRPLSGLNRGVPTRRSLQARRPRFSSRRRS
jgi:hypothetical protein